MPTYEFEKTPVNADRLVAEIAAGIAQPLAGFAWDSATGALALAFADALNEAAALALQGIIAAHTGEPLAPFKLHGRHESPRDLDLSLFGLQRKTTFNPNKIGEVSKHEYFAAYDPNTGTFSDLVADESFTITKDAQAVPVRVDTVLRWFRTDETIGDTKTIVNHLSYAEGLEFAKERRLRALTVCKAWAMANIQGYQQDGTPNAYHVLTQLQAVDILLYYEGITANLIAWINNSQLDYLTPDVKAGMIARL